MKMALSMQEQGRCGTDWDGVECAWVWSVSGVESDVCEWLGRVVVLEWR